MKDDLRIETEELTEADGIVLNLPFSFSYHCSLFYSTIWTLVLEDKIGWYTSPRECSPHPQRIYLKVSKKYFLLWNCQRLQVRWARIVLNYRPAQKQMKLSIPVKIVVISSLCIIVINIFYSLDMTLQSNSPRHAVVIRKSSQQQTEESSLCLVRWGIMHQLSPKDIIRGFHSCHTWCLRICVGWIAECLLS